MKNECQYCGSPAGNTPIVQDGELYCSDDCAGIVRFERMVEEHADRLCDWSGTAKYSEFYRLDGEPEDYRRNHR